MHIVHHNLHARLYGPLGVWSRNRWRRNPLPRFGVVVDNVVNYKEGELFFGRGSEEARGTVELVAGREYTLEMRQSMELLDGAKASPFMAASAFRIGAYPVVEAKQAREEAVEVAKKSNIVILVVGTNPDWESEGFDRKDML